MALQTISNPDYCGHSVYDSDDQCWKPGMSVSEKLRIFGYDLTAYYVTTKTEGKIKLNLIRFNHVDNDMVQKWIGVADDHGDSITEAVKQAIGYECDEITEPEYGFQGEM